MDFAELMTLEPHGPDTFVGIGPEYPWGGLYGGQIVAQSLRAAAQTVDDDYRVHSLHAYFIRQGDQSQPVRYEVDRIRDGRTFVTRRVVARQSVGAILNMAASFQREEQSPEAQIAELPDVVGPEDAEDDSWSPVFERRYAQRGTDPGRSIAWFRTKQSIADDQLLNACALAFISDDLPTEAIILEHPDRPESFDIDNWPFWNASLDHAIWFHRHFKADEWHLHDFTVHALMNSRGLAFGNIFTAAGVHVATIAQEVLVRPVRDR